MIRKRHIGISLSSVLVAAAMLFSACNRSEEIASSTKRVGDSDVVRFGVKVADRWTSDVIGDGIDPSVAEEPETRSGVHTRTEALPMDYVGESSDAEIFMYMIEEDCPPVVDTMAKATRATESAPDIGIYSYQVNSVSALTQYDPTADGITTFMDNVRLYSDGTYSGGDKYWPGAGTWLQFYAYRPYSTTVDGLSVQTVDNEPYFTYTVPTEVGKQRDLMEGASSLIKGSLTENVAITLDHILSQIRVKVGTKDVGEITSVTFKNIRSKGDHYVATHSKLTPKGWTVVGDTADYSPWSGTGNPTVDANNYVGHPMYLMPQLLSEDAEIEICLEVTSDNPHTTSDADKTMTTSYTLTKKLKEFAPKWEPNKQYTYIISTPLEVEVEVTDEVVNDNGKPKKQNLQIRNVGLAEARVRASIVGYWVVPDDDAEYDDDMIVAAWDPATDGVFVWGEGNGNAEPTATRTTGKWFKHNGYYYYDGNVARGTTVPVPLFESYTLTATPPVAGAVLDLVIVVQAVSSLDYTLAWDAYQQP